MLYGLSQFDVQRLRKLLNAFERGQLRVDAASHQFIPGNQQDTFLVNVPASIGAGDVGAGNIVQLDDSSPPTKTIDTDVSFNLYNSGSSSLSTGTYLVAREPSQGYYVPVAASASSSLTVTDGTNTVNNVTTLNFPELFVVSSPTGGEAAVKPSPSWSSVNYGYGGSTAVTTTAAVIPSFSLSLDGPATYLIWGVLFGQVGLSTGGSTEALYAQLYDNTNTTPITPYIELVESQLATVSGQLVGATATIMWPYQITGNITVGIRAVSAGPGNAGFGSDGNGTSTSSIVALKLA